DLTKKKMLVQFDSDIEAAQANLSAAKSTQAEEQDKLDELTEQLALCVINAPTDGVVVHANKFSSRGGSEFVVEAGASVRERQEIIRLPDPTRMQVKAKINESNITMVREGMPVKISVGAVDGLELLGRVQKVNRYAEPGSWFSSSVKEYATMIEIIDPPESIRTGMTAEVQIFVEQIPDAVQVPIQGIYEHGGGFFAMVQTGEVFETRELKIGASNDKMVALNEGLEEGETIVLNLREHLNLMDLPDVTAVDNTELATLVAKRGGPMKKAKEGEDSGPPPPPWMAGAIDKTFENDTDGDGTLDKKEIQAIDGRFRPMVATADKDKDGKVTRKEMTAAFMKSTQNGGGGRPGGGRPGGWGGRAGGGGRPTGR
ncbi:MAG: efflux RND transporter periplasmic adaptor subunit, partial [Planctomycetota bacterium]